MLRALGRGLNEGMTLLSDGLDKGRPINKIDVFMAGAGKGASMRTRSA